MKYDFTSIIDRKGKDALAVDNVGKIPGFAPDGPEKGFDLIPMWIADMNFATVPTIQEEIIKRVNHPTFGYFEPRDEYYQSIIEWQKNRNGITDLTKECIGYENGVLGGVMSALNIFCSKGDNVLVHSPSYVKYQSVLDNSGYKMITSELKLDENNIFRIDYKDTEQKIKDYKIHALIFCSPHNPCGRVWEKEELQKVSDICQKYQVNIISDEIWSDLILFNNKHVPFQTVSDYAKNNTIAFYAPSKTFNISGLIGAYHIIYNEILRDRYRKESSLSNYNEMNMLSMYSLIGAYKKEGYDWLNQLLVVLGENVEYCVEYINKHFEGVSVCKPQGTYMLFVNCTKWCEKNKKTIDDIEKEAWRVGVSIQDGRIFNGPCHFRMNVALPFSKVKEAMDRLDKYVFNKKVSN